MLQTIQAAGQALVDTAKAHPRLAIGGVVVGALVVAVLLDRAAGGSGIPLLGTPSTPRTPPGPPPSLPGGPLPPGTTALTSYLSDAFFVRLDQLGQYFRSKGAKVTAEEIMAVLYVESAGLFPKAVNAQSGCVGLNQICGSLTSVGFNGTKAEYLALSAEEQLTYVQAYYDKQGNIYPRIHTLGDLYLVNFSPAFLGQADDYVMYREGQSITHPFIKNRDGSLVVFGPIYYEQNAGIDRPKKGWIEVGDMSRFIISHVGGAKWNELRMRLQRVQAVA